MLIFQNFWKFFYAQNVFNNTHCIVGDQFVKMERPYSALMPELYFFDVSVIRYSEPMTRVAILFENYRNPQHLHG